MSNKVTILDPIDTRWVCQNIAGSFGSTYLTLLSIIQGVALGLWAIASIPNTDEAWLSLLTLEGVSAIGVRLTTLLLIIIIWHVYFWLAVTVRWIPGFIDSLLVFTIGLTELAAVLNMDQIAWFYNMAVLGILAGLAYNYNAKQLDKQGYSDDVHSQKLWVHMSSRRKQKGKRLLFHSLLFLIVVVILHVLVSYLQLPELFTIAIIFLLALEIWLIKRHTDRRNGTLKILSEARETST